MALRVRNFFFGDEPRDDIRQAGNECDAEVVHALEHADHGLRVEAIDE